MSSDIKCDKDCNDKKGHLTIPHVTVFCGDTSQSAAGRWSGADLKKMHRDEACRPGPPFSQSWRKKAGSGYLVRW